LIFITSNITGKPSAAVKLIVYILLLCPVSILFISPAVVLSETRKIAIVPFQINSSKDISYIKNGVFQMLSSRLTWKEALLVATEKEVKESLVRSSALNAGPKKVTNVRVSNSTSDIKRSELVSQLAADTGSDYVIQGSITEFAGAFSVDATVFNIRQNSSQSFFTQAETPEKIIPGVEILSAKINMDIFNRKSSALARIDEEKNSSSLNNIRANPEKMMPQPTLQQSEKKRPFWKFWSKDNGEEDEDELSGNNPASSNSNSASTQLEPEEDIVIHTETETEEQEENKKPFWKFW